MSESSEATFLAGDIVKLRQPADNHEATALFDVVEVRLPRVLIRLRCDLPIPPMENVLASEIERVERVD
jgi:hypothetical protein